MKGFCKKSRSARISHSHLRCMGAVTQIIDLDSTSARCSVSCNGRTNKSFLLYGKRAVSCKVKNAEKYRGKLLSVLC